ncbi:PREDICTED: ataxin-3-like [Habropoda laboriosa]|uniref:ataxin-3-like n=1 Tax=Habropoda laboriosa TaxID=597456 RepID=UPI00083DF5C7|nr:PREDICTED: ataxin-3-like [Habropoda laboriosa]
MIWSLLTKLMCPKGVNKMDIIFHEKQEGFLCAQHCLNALLQGPYFNAVDLAIFGQQMDEEERLRMAESGVDSEDYKLFLEQPSGNMDDSGYFSVQVISSALKVWGLELIPYNSTESAAIMAQNDPLQMKAYICNYKGHWFTIRKIGRQWFNLNSVLNGPELISDTYLSMYLAQLLQEGYSIFIVIGTLPQCPADDILMRNPTESVSKGQTSSKTEVKGSSSSISNTFAKALSSKEKIPTSKPQEKIIPIKIEKSDEDDDDNAELQRALQLSFEDNKRNDVDKYLKLSLDFHDYNKKTCGTDDTDEDDDLRRALQLSLECATAPPTPESEDLHWRQLNHFGTYSRTSNGETSQKLNI